MITFTPKDPMNSDSTPPTETSTSVMASPGIFFLPHAENNHHTTPIETPRSGGTKASREDSDEAALVDSSTIDDDVSMSHQIDHSIASDFPMIVWLRGDEPWFHDFNMDADGVMKTLGIKRSRLTQISGRDLRVGRVRVDRYIRPIYRSLDVQQYLNWTRATASHQKSSDSIKLATSQLQEQSLLIQTTIETISTNFTAALKEEMSSFIATTVAGGLLPLEHRLAVFHDSVLELTNQLTSRIAATLAATSEQMNQTTEIVNQSTKLQSAALEVLTLQLNQTSEKTVALEARLASWDKILMKRLNEIAGDLQNLKEPSPFRKAPPRKNPRLRQNVLEPKKPSLILRSAPSRRKPK
jgi:CheY-specific phosphatase CheX